VNRPAIAKPPQPNQFRLSQPTFTAAPLRETPTTPRPSNTNFFGFQEEKDREVTEAVVDETTTPLIDYYDESVEYEDLLEGKSTCFSSNIKP